MILLITIFSRIIFNKNLIISLKRHYLITTVKMYPVDIPNILPHVIVGRIEKRDIFTGDDDRHGFVTRFSHRLESKGTECLAWALLSKQFHLQIRVKEIPLSKFMRHHQPYPATCRRGDPCDRPSINRHQNQGEQNQGEQKVRPYD